MRFNDAYCNKISLRLSDTQYDYLKTLADDLGVSVSDLLRMIIDGYIIRGAKEYER